MTPARNAWVIFPGMGPPVRDAFRVECFPCCGARVRSGSKAVLDAVRHSQKGYGCFGGRPIKPMDALARLVLGAL